MSHVRFVSSVVDKYWDRHTVLGYGFKTAHQSEMYLHYRYWRYPLFSRLWGYGCRSGDVALDYGCGPGNDVVGMGLYVFMWQIMK